MYELELVTIKMLTSMGDGWGRSWKPGQEIQVRKNEAARLVATKQAEYVPSLEEQFVAAAKTLGCSIALTSETSESSAKLITKIAKQEKVGIVPSKNGKSSI